MPLFFREEKETSIKDAGEELKAEKLEHLPAVVPAQELGHAVVPARDQTNLFDSLEQVPTDPPEVVPSRKTRPFNRMLAAAVAMMLVPLLLLLFRIGTDAFTRDFVCARLDWIMKDNRGAITYFSKALQERQDNRAFEARADCYEQIGDLENERADLRKLIQSLDSKKVPDDREDWHIYGRYSKLATLEARLGDLGKADRLYQLYGSVLSRENSASYYKTNAAYELLLLDDIFNAKAFLTQVNADKPDILGQALSARDASGKGLQALICREEGDRARALDTIKSIGDTDAWEFRDSRFRYDCKNEVVPWSLEALICLDQNNPGKARSLLQLAQSELGSKDKSKPILDILNGWVLLEEGRLDDCLKLTGDTLANEKELDQSIDGLNLKAALHLIRKHVFLRQNLTNQVAQEDELYKQCHVSGRLFTPICFRPNP